MRLKLLPDSFHDIDVNNRILCETTYFFGLPFKFCVFTGKKSSIKYFFVMHPMGFVPIYRFKIIGSSNCDVSLHDLLILYYMWCCSTFDDQPFYKL